MTADTAVKPQSHTAVAAGERIASIPVSICNGNLLNHTVNNDKYPITKAVINEFKANHPITQEILACWFIENKQNKHEFF